MNRLTMKISEGFYTAPNIANTDELKYKLGQLEDIEEELGCPLDIIFKALKNNKVRAIHPINKNIEEAVYVTLYYLGQQWCLGFNSFVWNEKERKCDSWDLFLKDYKKTWALTKEELEHD